MLEEILKSFRDFIRKKGLKYTSEREEILQEILSIDGHFDVEELYQRLRQKNKKISKPSIYRSLPLFIEAGYIQEVYRQDGHSHYEVTINKAPHLHFLCLRCGKVEEIIDPELERLIQLKEAEKGFKLLTHHLESFGICETCQKAETITLDMVEKGKVVEVLDLPTDVICKKLIAMGLRKGELVKVLQVCGRTMLVEIGNSRIVINKELASKIPVKIVRTEKVAEEVPCELINGEEALQEPCPLKDRDEACQGKEEKGDPMINKNCPRNFLIKLLSKL